jgi:hypothetical protein
MNNSFFMNIDEIQPSQLYLNSRKIEKGKKKYKIINPEQIKVVPIKKLKDQIIFVDGHTRAYVLWTHGYKKIKVVWEDEELDWEAYQIGVDWCKEAGITAISDLNTRIIDNESYQIKWIKRCQDMFSELEKKRKIKK